MSTHILILKVNSDMNSYDWNLCAVVAVSIAVADDDELTNQTEALQDCAIVAQPV